MPVLNCDRDVVDAVRRMLAEGTDQKAVQDDLNLTDETYLWIRMLVGEGLDDLVTCEDCGKAGMGAPGMDIDTLYVHEHGEMLLCKTCRVARGGE